MHAIERLRHIARAGDVDASELAAEAAYALASLASEPWALVPACRRLLEFHPGCAPLWWVAAHLLGATDIRTEAYRLIDELEADPTHEELAASFAGSARVVAECRRTLLRALAARPDLEVVLAGAPYELRRGLRLLAGLLTPPLGATGDEIDRVLDGLATDGGRPAVVVVEARAAGPQGVLLTADAAHLAFAGARAGLGIDVVAGVGRVLPAALFDELALRVGAIARDGEAARPADAPARAVIGEWHTSAGDRADGLGEGVPVMVPVELVRTLTGPNGRRPASVALRRVGGPVPTELCRGR